jgi:putative transposase
MITSYTVNLTRPVFATRPNETWVTDITYVPTAEGWLYLAGIKDLFTCEVVGHAMGARMTTNLVSDAFRKAVETKRPRPGLIHHSDRGSHIVLRTIRSNCGSSA